MKKLSFWDIAIFEPCDRVMWMHDGEVREIGEPVTVLEKYAEFMTLTS